MVLNELLLDRAWRDRRRPYKVLLSFLTRHEISQLAERIPTISISEIGTLLLV